ncbi:MAG TPA: type II secretion system protein [Chthoniobacterales bacterium]|jgi:type II secretory pathway pseudopilin PulG|nr:type II secretion system protein [Chthoniobacterales bacterium]
MKTKGFTLVELVVACTLLIMLSTIATTSTYNFVQATANLKAQYNNIQNIMALHSVLVNAKMNYATDLALESSNPNNPPNATELAIQSWNISARQNDNAALIRLLISPGFSGLPLANPGGSYLPTSHNGVPITDMDSLLRAFQLTDNAGNIVATISVGPMLDVGPPVTRAMLPIIDWRSGTPQEIQF